jgi:uncharacterized surface protein with fasciclin (FAS1) repeats
MKIISDNKITISLLLLLLVVGITVFTVNNTLNAHVENKYQSYIIDGDKTIYENLESIPEFSIFLSDAARTGNDSILKDSNKNLIVFAPNNEGYFNIDSFSRSKLEELPSLHKLDKIIDMHIVEGSSLSFLNKNSEVTTINGQKLRVVIEGDKTLIRDSVGNSFEIEKAFYQSANGYFIKVSQVLLPFSISFVNGVQIESDDDIKENVETFAGVEKLSDSQKSLLGRDNITFVYQPSLTHESHIEDNILEGSYNSFQLESVSSVKTIEGKVLDVTKSDEGIKVGEILISNTDRNLESKNGFIHIGL